MIILTPCFAILFRLTWHSFASSFGLDIGELQSHQIAQQTLAQV